MIGDKRVLAIIPARGGSKGVPRKNILPLAGKPLIGWTIEAAKKSRFIDRTILSSEDARIIKTAKELGCEVPFVRPKKLAADKTPGIAPVLHAIHALPQKYDYIILLQPTSPLRTSADIDGALKLCIAGGYSSCVSVFVPKDNPYWMYVKHKEGYLKPFVASGKKIYRRQDLPKVYALNGAIYIAKTKLLLARRSFISVNTLPFEMPETRSVDIDTKLDFIIAAACFQNPR